MAKLRSQVSMLVLSLVMLMSQQALADTIPEYQAFVGDWELVSYVVFPADGAELPAPGAPRAR